MRNETEELKQKKEVKEWTWKSKYHEVRNGEGKHETKKQRRGFRKSDLLNL